ncbi:prephenate dehydrogenase [Rhizohabitans arisaemae]|uniref:prephenate dehydrogenase n=1 Tax=Rhizohabitans arisaemae TaxID=2720610 RepID=UPI0024B11DD5|nr:prephenate dehydrogenase [Rhizohabitans arisaemae]
MRSVLVLGTGLIGTSIALALREHGVRVLLSDVDEESMWLARNLGAGEPWRSGERVDLAVLGVPPQVVGEVLAGLQKEDAARVYTDVASVKAMPVAQARAHGCDMTSFVPGHPMAGRERSGPAAARRDLFLGRPWAICPTSQTAPEALDLVRHLAALCGGKIMELGADEHDAAVALVSHVPHITAAAVAARLAEAPEGALGLAGQGVRDVTRIAGGDPGLWTGILAGNTRPVADVLDALCADLAEAARALRAGETVTDLLRRGVRGRSRIPGKHGGPAKPYTVVQVVIEDIPGELARLFQAAGEARVNIEDVVLEHSPGLPVGVAELSVRPEEAAVLAEALRAHGWHVPK